MKTVSATPAGVAHPRWRAAVVLLAAIASAGLAFRLGVWQLDRAHQKLALQANLDARGGLPPLASAELARRPHDVDAQVDRRTRLAGRWIGGRTVFLDNRQMDGRVGFFVVTPLALEGSSDAVLVQRGFVPRHFDVRTALPDIASPAGVVDVDGRVAATPSRMLELGTPASGPIRQNVDAAAFSRESGLSLLPLAVVEQETGRNASDGLLRHWPPPPPDLQKHYGYAFQWFAIGTVIVVLYVWFRILRLRRRAD